MVRKTSTTTLSLQASIAENTLLMEKNWANLVFSCEDAAQQVLMYVVCLSVCPQVEILFYKVYPVCPV